MLTCPTVFIQIFHDMFSGKDSYLYLYFVVWGIPLLLMYWKEICEAYCNQKGSNRNNSTFVFITIAYVLLIANSVAAGDICHTYFVEASRSQMQ